MNTPKDITIEALADKAYALQQELRRRQTATLKLRDQLSTTNQMYEFVCESLEPFVAAVIKVQEAILEVDHHWYFDRICPQEDRRRLERALKGLEEQYDRFEKRLAKAQEAVKNAAE